MTLSRIARNRAAVILAILIGLVIVIGLINPAFINPDTLLSIVNSSLVLVLIAIGETFVLLTRGIDVSIGAVMGISAVILGTALNANVPLPVAIVLALLTGSAAGSLNGLGVTMLRVPPIIMTLGMMGVLRGLMLIITDGSWIETIPQNIKDMAGWNIAGISVFAIVVVLISIGATVLLRRVRVARYWYAVGDNEEGAYLAGIPVKLAKFTAFTMAGLFAGLASVIFVAQIGFVPMQTGEGQEMRAIAASVLGGVNLAGGVGTPLSALVGGVFLTVIDSVLIFLKVPAFWNNAIAGAILLIVVLIDFRIRKAVETKQRVARAHTRAVAAGAALRPQAATEEKT